MLTEKQLEERKKYIGGSDASTICGVNPWGNIIDLWQEKIGLKEAEDISQKPSIRAGNYLEPVVANWFADDTGKAVEIEPETLFHKSIPYMAANIDRRITGEKAILECKTAGRDIGWGKDGDNTIPDYYLCQVAHYAAVCDVERAYIAVLIAGNDFRWYTYERNAKLEEMIIAREKAFWKCVWDETPPEPRTTDEILSLYSEATLEETLLSNEQIENAVDNLKSVKEIIKQKEEEKEALEKTIKLYMRGHDTIKDLSGKVLCTWKNAKAPTRFDSKKFADENQELYNKYLKTGETNRRFIIK